MRSFEERRLEFEAVYAAARGYHASSKKEHHGHGLDHDATVAQFTQIIAPQALADQAWVAAMVHSFDRILPPGEVESVTRRVVALAGRFTKIEQEEIVQAALRHDEMNQDDQSLLQQVLMDADRLANLQALIIVRAAQHHPDVPAIDLRHMGSRDPDSTHVAPRSVLDNLRDCLEWEDWFRIPAAKELAKDPCRYLREYIDRAEKTYRDLGLAGLEL